MSGGGVMKICERSLNEGYKSANKGEEGSKFWSFCDNVITECPRMSFSLRCLGKSQNQQ